jgi:acyl-CoA reductase-like NAD-dependent aldehyde dehydrogenase
MLPSSPPLTHPDLLYIGGEWVRSSSTDLIDVIAPATEELYLRVASATVSDIDRAVAAARRAFDKGPWRRMSPSERAGYMLRLADELDLRTGDIAAIWPNEMGVLYKTAKAYSAGIGDFYRYYAGLADTFPFEESHPTNSGARFGLLVREAVGVVGAIIPWNAPVSLIAFKLAPALLAGCSVVIKASPEAPGQALVMAEVAEAAGIPPGVINVVTAERDASAALVRNPGIDKIAFTGSSATGMAIASVLGARMARYTMELGGKSAAIILDDYDIETAARAIVGQGCDLTGQVCASLTRVIVPRSRHDKMVEALAAAFGKITVGDPFDANAEMGPLATARQRERVEGHIARAKRDGFQLAVGGRRPPHLPRGFFVEPTVFGHVDNRSGIAQEEVFGPVLAVIPSDSEEQAIELANDSPFGLNGSVFTNDTERAFHVAREVRSGTFGHNSIRMDFGIAFGGFKQSGVGREGGIEGLRPYLETKTLLMDSLLSA